MVRRKKHHQARTLHNRLGHASVYTALGGVGILVVGGLLAVILTDLDVLSHEKVLWLVAGGLFFLAQVVALGLGVFSIDERSGSVGLRLAVVLLAVSVVIMVVGMGWWPVRF